MREHHYSRNFMNKVINFNYDEKMVQKSKKDEEFIRNMRNFLEKKSEKKNCSLKESYDYLNDVLNKKAVDVSTVLLNIYNSDILYRQLKQNYKLLQITGSTFLTIFYKDPIMFYKTKVLRNALLRVDTFKKLLNDGYLKLIPAFYSFYLDDENILRIKKYTRSNVDHRGGQLYAYIASNDGMKTMIDKINAAAISANGGKQILLS